METGPFGAAKASFWKVEASARAEGKLQSKEPVGPFARTLPDSAGGTENVCSPNSVGNEVGCC